MQLATNHSEISSLSVKISSQKTHAVLLSQQSINKKKKTQTKTA